MFLSSKAPFTVSVATDTDFRLHTAVIHLTVYHRFYFKYAPKFTAQFIIQNSPKVFKFAFIDVFS